MDIPQPGSPKAHPTQNLDLALPLGDSYLDRSPQESGLSNLATPTDLRSVLSCSQVAAVTAMTRLSPTLLAVATLMALLPRTATASDLTLSFDLAPVGNAPPPDTPPPDPIAASPVPVVPAHPEVQPLPVPPQAAQPPTRSHPATLPTAVHPNGVGPVALSQDWLPPPALPTALTALAQAESSQPDPPPPSSPTPDPIALVFELDLPPASNVPIANSRTPAPHHNQTPSPVLDPVATAEAPAPSVPSLLSLFEGETNSLVARAVGSAEGTRTPDGGHTAAYNGHTDPGNQAWNLGTFSYQHGATSPEEADRLQLQRLQRQSQVIKRRAQAHNLTLTLDETLNGIDLANQSPLAAIGRVGYIERLAEARSQGLSGHEAIVWARTHAYINPDTNRWNAPGLGNTYPSIRRDQERRARAVARALAAYREEKPHFPPTWTLVPEESILAPEPVLEPAPEPAPEPIDDIFQLGSAPRSLPAAPAPLTLAPTTEVAAAPTSRVWSPVRPVATPPSIPVLAGTVPAPAAPMPQPKPALSAPIILTDPAAKPARPHRAKTPAPPNPPPAPESASPRQAQFGISATP